MWCLYPGCSARYRCPSGFGCYCGRRSTLLCGFRRKSSGPPFRADLRLWCCMFCSGHFAIGPRSLHCFALAVGSNARLDQKIKFLVQSLCGLLLVDALVLFGWLFRCRSPLQPWQQGLGCPSAQEFESVPGPMFKWTKSPTDEHPRIFCPICVGPSCVPKSGKRMSRFLTTAK